jgi:hypothetical protein
MEMKGIKIMEWIKKILEETKVEENKIDIESIIKAVNTEFPKHAVTKSDFNNINEQLKTANATIKSFDGKFTEEDVTKLKKDHEAEIKRIEAEQKKKDEEKDFEDWLNGEFKDVKSIDDVSLKANLDIEALKNSEDRKANLAEQLKPIQESKGYLFDTSNTQENENVYNYDPQGGSNPPNTLQTQIDDIFKNI